PGAFRVGVAVPFGHLAVAEGTTAGGVFSLARVGIAADLAVAEGAVTARDLPLDHAAATTFTAPQALAGLDTAFAVTDLRFDLALQQPSGRVVDVVRAVGGNLLASGQDAVLTLPPLDGALVGGAWLLALGATVNTGGTSTATQRSLQRLAGGAL